MKFYQGKLGEIQGIWKKKCLWQSCPRTWSSDGLYSVRKALNIVMVEGILGAICGRYTNLLHATL